MKILSLFIALTLFIAAPALAGQDGKPDAGRDACLLNINDCPPGHYYDIVEKIARLRAAIEIGTRAYTPEEVEHLKNLLAEAFEIADMIDADSSQVPENKDR